jgi:hypothetical protein
LYGSEALKTDSAFAHFGVVATLASVVAPALSTITLILLVGSGISKALRPDPTRGALRAAHLPSSRPVARALGVGEIAAGVVGLLFGALWLAPATLLYLGFLAFTLAAVRRRIPVQSCGCFGAEDTPPTAFHVGFNAVAAGVLALMAVTSQYPVTWSWPRLELALYIGYATIGAYLSYLLLALLPRTFQMTLSR